VKELQRRGDPDVCICLCGNKADLAADRQVDPEVRGEPCEVRSWSARDVLPSLQEVEQYAKSCGLLTIETSARSGFNVKEMFTAIGLFVFGSMSSQCLGLAHALLLDSFCQLESCPKLRSLWSTGSRFANLPLTRIVPDVAELGAALDSAAGVVAGEHVCVAVIPKGHFSDISGLCVMTHAQQDVMHKPTMLS